MVRSQLVKKMAEENPQLQRSEVERIVDSVFDEIATALANRDRVELRGFGTFSVKKRRARTARNPRTGAPVLVKEKYTPFFRTGKLLRERLNKNYK